MNFNELYEEIYRILPRGSLQELTEVCYKIMGLPTLVVDIMYNLLGIAPDEPIDDILWDHLQIHRGFDTEQIADLYKDGILQSADKMKAPYIVDWGSSKDKPKIQGVIRINDNIEGYVTMSCPSEEITEEKLQAMDIIMHVCAFFFKRNESESSMQYTFQKVFAGELFGHRIQSEKQLQTWFYDMGCEYAPPYRVAAVSSYSGNEKNYISYLRKAMQSVFPSCILLIQENILYVLRYKYGSTPNGLDDEKPLLTIMTQFNARCGVSNTFDSLLDVSNYQRQAEDALIIGKEIDPDKHLHYYHNYSLPSILLPRIKEMNRENYLPLVITKMANYDKVNDTEFLPTLQCHIKNLLNNAYTAKELHIHRNTLLYRLNKIEELFNISLKDRSTFTELIIAFYMIELESKIYSHD